MTGSEPKCEIVGLVQRLTELTERQLAAARTLDGESLSKFNQARTDLMFELQIRLDAALPLDHDTQTALVREVETLTLLEARLIRIAGIVSAALNPIAPRQRPATYGRSGALSAR